MLSMLVQTIPNRSAKSIERILLKMGVLKNELDDKDLGGLDKRIKLIENWINKYVYDDIKIKVNESSPPGFSLALNQNEKAAISQLINEMKKEYEESELQSAVYEIAREHNVEPKKFFQILYQILISKDSGPRLAPFMLAIGKDKISKLLSLNI